MTRVPYHDTEEGLDEEQLRVFAHIKESRGSVVGVFSVLLNSAKVAELVADYGKYMRFDSILSDTAREITIATALAEHSSQFEWGYHEEFLLGAGVPQETIDAIKYKHDVDGVSDDVARELIQYGRELFRNKRASAATYATLERRYNLQEITEITALLAYYACVSTVLNAFEVPPTPGKAVLPEPQI